MITKKSKSEESKLKKLKINEKKSSVLLYINKPIKFNCKNKRKKWLKKKKNSTLIIEDNAIEDKKKRTFNNTSQMTYYNCQKKNYFANKYTKLNIMIL